MLLSVLAASCLSAQQVTVGNNLLYDASLNPNLQDSLPLPPHCSKYLTCGCRPGYEDDPVVAHISEYRPYDNTRILRKERGALYVHFDLGKSQLSTDYRENRQTLDRIVEITRQIMADSTSSVKTIQIVGLASIEGTPVKNEQLSVNRAVALQRYIQQQVAVPDSLFEIVGGGEAWVEFLDQLNDAVEAGDPANAQLSQVIDIIREEPDAKARERRIKELNEGRTWSYLKQHVLTDQRNSGYIRIYYDYVHDKGVAAINGVSGLSSTCRGDCRCEPLPLPQTASYAERDQNAPGTDLWLNGQKDFDSDVDSLLPRRELLSVKTNLLFYGVWMPNYNRWCPIPNIGIEYYPKRGHFTFGASLDFPWWRHWSQHKFFQIRNYQLEARYYLRDGGDEANETNEANRANRKGGFRGFYFLGYVHGGLFEIGFNKDTGWKGEGIGAGVGVGYVMPISKNGHWRLDFGLQLGWMTCRYDPYQYENLINLDYHDDLYYYRWTGRASDFKKRQYRFNWLGPTRVGVTLSYDLLYRRQSKKGVSFKAFEANRANGANEAERRAEP